MGSSGRTVSNQYLANRGGPYEEAYDEGFTFTNARRRSNSSSHTRTLEDFKSKFEVNEQEPVFEEDIHGPVDEHEDDKIKVVDEAALQAIETSSTSTGDEFDR